MGCRRWPSSARRTRPGSARIGPSWAADLARNLRWDAVIYGVSGAGYVQTGTYGAGPMTRQLGAEQLPGLSPSLVIVQAGYDDVQVPPGLERQQVDRTIKLIRTEAPHAVIGLVTVFASTTRPIPAGFYHIDATIVAAARAADPNAIIMDPLAGQWTYQHAHHGLHPTVAGDAWIAGKVGAILHAHGIASHPGGPPRSSATPAWPGRSARPTATPAPRPRRAS